MPISHLSVKPGVVRDVTQSSGLGLWYDCDKVRFRLGYPEKIGGWRSFNKNQYTGECCGMHQWNDLSSDRWNGVATNSKLYVEQSGTLSDITPFRRAVTLGADPFFAGFAHSYVAVTDVGHGASKGDRVTFSGATGYVGVNAVRINKEFEVVSITSPDVYTVDIGSVVAGPGTNFGGAAVLVQYQLPVGISSQLLGSGWGSGPYSRGGWGSGFYNTTYLFRIWSMDNFGQELLALPNYGGLYKWNPLTDGIATRAISIATLPGANLVPLTAGQCMVSDERHVICFGSNEWNSAEFDPMLVRWSAQADYLDWEPRPDNTSGSYRLPLGSTMVAARKSKGENLIWTDKGMYSMQFVGPPYTFGFSLISDGLNILGPRAAINARNSTYWMDSNQFFLYNGSVIPLECPLREFIFDDFNYGQRYKVFAMLNSAFNEIWWHYPSKQSQTCDRVAIYNFLTNEWAPCTMNRTAGIDLALDGKPVMANGGNLYQHENGTDDDLSAMPAWIESGDLLIGDGDTFSFVKRIIPDVTFFDCENPQLTYIVKQRDFPANSMITRAQKIMTPTGNQLHVRIRGRQIIQRFESDTFGTTWRLGATRVELQSDGRR